MRTVCAFLLTAVLVALAIPDLRWVPPPIAPRGGSPFDLVLPVPGFRQDDPQWAGETIGGSGEALSEVGCALSSAAMVATFLGVPMTPQSLNARLKQRDGYTRRGWLRWQAVADASAGVLRLTWAGGADHDRLDATLRSGVPVIVRVPPSASSPSGATGHWLVVVGKRGADYLVNDPQRTHAAPLVLADVATEIRAMRVFRAAPPGGWPEP